MLSPSDNKKAGVPATIAKNPVLQPDEDYYFLRRKGIEYIEQMGSRWWTDYNSHDPGITILEALCYAITELGFRIGKDIKEILAEAPESGHTPERQAFFSARAILTVNPLTIDDYRRSLIDLDNIANAWLIGRQCQCEVQLYADCKQDRLSYTQPPTQDKEIKVAALGAYDVLLELDHDPELGDLNDRKVKDSFILKVNGKNLPLTIEFRFPDWEVAAWQPASHYYGQNGIWLRKIQSISIDFSLFKSGQQANLGQEEENRRWRQWRRVFFADMTIDFGDSRFIVLSDIPVKLFGSSELSQMFKEDWDFDDIKQAFFIGVAEQYVIKTATAERALEVARLHLNGQRNLCEDFCNLSLVCIEDVAVCADIEITPDADIERVLANVLFEIERYFDPGLKFYTLQELLAENVPVDEIFDGPPLQHGFIKQADLDAAQLKSQLRTSDIINRLVEIEGVVAIKNLLLTRYDRYGQVVAGVADGGADKDKTSAAWTLDISDRCQPKLYVDNSRFIFYKNGLPFIPRASEVQDTLNELRGQDERIKIRNLTIEELDLSVPKGDYRPSSQYYPVQYTFPQTYGIGFEGVRRPATEKRFAQAKQLKGYLLIFEQLLANAFAQIDNIKNLFALDASELHSYFFTNLRHETIIRGVTELVSPLMDDTQLQQLVETEPERLDRRNRVIDHLMSRFAESFSEYAMMLHSLDLGMASVTQTDLIEKKIAFLKSYPFISRNRDRSFNYLKPSVVPDNQAVLRKRIALLLGLNPSQEENIIIVEHLLLRPKFPGDALMEICLGNHCNECDGRADPYSFQMTIIMPGWQEPFNSNIELRRFADRTIQQEVPSHLLAKTCWVSNLNYGEGWDDRLLEPLSDYLRKHGKNAGSVPPSEANAKQGAKKLLKAARPIFISWIASGASEGQNENAIQKAIKEALGTQMPDLVAIYGGVKNYDEIGDAIYTMLADFFTEIAVSELWYQFNRYKVAWHEWLMANAGFNWQNEPVLPKIELLLLGLGISRKDSQAGKRRACRVTERFGEIFSQAMKQNVLDALSFDTTDQKNAEVLRIFNLAFTDAILSELGIALEHKEKLSEKFVEIYPAYFDVTIKLWKVVLRLAKLHSIYPPATLHDCDDGNDDNPVRLGSTMLGG